MSLTESLQGEAIPAVACWSAWMCIPVPQHPDHHNSSLACVAPQNGCLGWGTFASALILQGLALLRRKLEGHP